MTQWYCVAPFRHVYVDNLGVSACCQQKKHPTNLAEWPSYPALLELQKSFLNGEVPQGCQGCKQNEEKFNTSLRLQSNRDYDNNIFTDTSIDFIDYRSSNLCNFKCRSCHPVFSHGIAKEVNEYPEILKNFFPTTEKFLKIDDQNYHWIKNNLGQIKRLMFTGGEPTVMPNVKSIIQSFIDNNKTDTSILITTNCSFIDDFWKEIVHIFPDLHWTLSLDATDSAAGIVRSGTDWNTVQHNARWLSANASSVMINTVVTNLNIFHLGPLLTFVRDLQKQNSNKQNGLTHQFHVSQRPYYLSADNLTTELKQLALEYIGRYLMLDLDRDQIQMLTSLREMLHHSEFDHDLWIKSCEYNHELDKIRNQDHTVLFPVN